MTEETAKEAERMFRVSDQMTSMHSLLSDRLRKWALAADIFVLIGSGLSASLTFVDPSVAKILNPIGTPPSITLGVFSLLIFLITLIQLRIDLSGQAALHSKAAESWATLKHELGRLNCKGTEGTNEEFAAIRARYESVTTTLVKIPDRRFPTLKRKHKIKIEISRVLDSQPGAWIWLLRLRIWWRDNFARSKQKD